MFSWLLLNTHSEPGMCHSAHLCVFAQFVLPEEVGGGSGTSRSSSDDVQSMVIEAAGVFVLAVLVEVLLEEEAVGARLSSSLKKPF